MSNVPSQTRFVSTAEGRLAYDLAPSIGGATRTFLCAPSLGDTRAEYAPLAPSLRALGTVITADLRGHGESDATFRRYDADALAEDTIAIMDAEKIERCVLVGCSVSGGAAIVTAARFPERVEGLVLLAPFSRKVRGEALLGWLMGALLIGPWAPSIWGSYYRSLYKKHQPATLDAHIASLREMLRDPARRRALVATIRGSKGPVQARRALVRAPTEVIMGGADPDFSSPADEAALLCDAIGSHAQRAVLDGLGHYPHVEAPALVLARIEALMTRLDAAQPSVPSCAQ